MKTNLRRDRGSLLIVAMLLAAIIAIALTSYIKMAVTAVQLSQRASFANEAMNLTETGLEEAMAAINANTWTTPWSTSGSNATGTFSGFSLSNGATGQVKVYVQNYATSTPFVVAQGVVTLGNGTQITKMVEISGFIQRSLFGKGLVGINGVTFKGNNPSVDSWNSRYNDDGTARSSPVAYSSSVAHDDGSIAAVNVTATDTVQNADIWGSASVGGNSTSAITVGPQGLVGPYGTSNGTINPANVSANFTANLPTITAPSPTVYNTISGGITSQTSLPGAGDHAASDGKYYYYVSSVSLSGGGHNTPTLTITSGANVVLLTQAGSGTSAVSIAGNGEIDVQSGAHLDIYANGNISIGGNGLMNENQNYNSSALQIWGTNTQTPSPGQSISVAGNGTLACTCYAPNASITANGGGSGSNSTGQIYGSFVGYSVTMSGNDAFHYDESLGSNGTSGIYQPSKWRELVSATDRSTYSSVLSF